MKLVFRPASRARPRRDGFGRRGFANLIGAAFAMALGAALALAGFALI